MGSISQVQGYVLLIVFGVAMFLATRLGSREHLWRTQVGFLAANRDVPWWLGAVSIAVSWIWAPALFVSVQQAYQQGVPGLFWFTLPNILCLFIMAPLAKRIRREVPDAFSQPEWIRVRFDNRTHKMYLVPFFWYQLMAVTVQLFAGGSFVSLLTGIDLRIVMVLLAAITLLYAMLSGMRASIITDFIQYALIVLGGAVILPWTLSAAGGIDVAVGGIGGVTGAHRSIFDPAVALNFGIITTIGLISGVLSDQQHWQRAFTIKEGDLRKAYLAAGVLFAVVPLGLGLLGFIAANPAAGVALPQGVDPSMIGVVTVAHYLPSWAIAIFIVMLLGGLCSTLDSGMLAASALYSADVKGYSDEERRIMKKRRAGNVLSSTEQIAAEALDARTVRDSRNAMIGITVAGMGVAFAVLYIPGFGLQYLWWVFNTIAACVAVPTVMSLYSRSVDSKGVFWGVLTAFVFGIPLFVYGNSTGSVPLQVGSSVGIVLVTVVFCLLWKRPSPYQFRSEEGRAERSVIPGPAL